MNKLTTILFFFFLVSLTSCTNYSNNSGQLFNGKDLDNWQTSGNVMVRDSLLILSGTHTTASLKNSVYKDFELKLKVRTKEGSKGFIGFHTDDSGKGYFVALNNDLNDPVWWRKTGSLLSVRNLTKSLVKEDEWFDMDIRVEGQEITVRINGEPVVEYMEPEEPYRRVPFEKALLSEGTISISSTGPGEMEFKNISIDVYEGNDINVPVQLMMARNEQEDDIIRLHQEDFPVLDYHVHLKGGFTKEAAAKQSRKLGINYAIAPNCGIGFPITDDKGIYNFLKTMRSEPFILAMQGEGREWTSTFSEEARNEFDYVFTDALTFNDMKDRRVHLWINDEVIIDDEEEYMDMIVDRTCEVLQEPAHVFVNPFFLPEQMNDRYDFFWTEERVDKVITALKEGGMALEINELYNIPNKTIIIKAKDAGIKFTFGSNNISPEVGKLEYSIRMKKECGLSQEDMYRPQIKL